MKKTIAFICTMIIFLCLSACGQSQSVSESPEDLYSSIQKQINNAEELKANYLSQFVDTKDLDAAIEAAEQTVSNSDEESYQEVLTQLETQITSTKERIQEESDKYYNIPTTDRLDAKYPYKIDSAEVPDPWDFSPIIKQSSKNPTWIITNEPQTTDGKTVLCLFIGNSSADYYYEISNIKTKEIDVQDSEKNIQTALVNTEVKITVNEGHRYLDEAVFYDSHPAYLFKDKNDNIILALKCRDDGADYYILYGPRSE